MASLFQPNRTLEEMLLGRANIPLLEPIIMADAERFSRIVGKQLDFGKAVGRRQAMALLAGIAGTVDSFLGTGGISMPTILYNFAEGFHYNHISSRILAQKAPLVELIIELSHEYAHHLQCKSKSETLTEDDHDYRSFMEGHARGVARHCARQFMEDYGNEAFMFTVSGRDLMEHLCAYKWMCKINGIREMECVTKHALLLPEGDRCYLIDNHAIGNTIFSIHEAMHGDGIYREALK